MHAFPPAAPRDRAGRLRTFCSLHDGGAVVFYGEESLLGCSGRGDRGSRARRRIALTLQPARVRVAQALTDDACVIRNRNFRGINVRMPKFFPLETIEAFVADGA